MGVSPDSGEAEDCEADAGAECQRGRCGSAQRRERQLGLSLEAAVRAWFTLACDSIRLISSGTAPLTISAASLTRKGFSISGSEVACASEPGSGSYVLLNRLPVSTMICTDSTVAGDTDSSYEVMSVDTKGVQNPRSNVFAVEIP